MALELEDIKFFKSQMVTDTEENGGRMDETKQIISNVKYNLFPRVTYLERTNGYTRYRKEFISNRNADNEKAYGALYALMMHQNGQDRFYIRPGSMTDTQSDIESQTEWYGGGKLASDVVAGATEIQIEFQADDYTILNNSQIVIGTYHSSSDSFVDISVCRTANDEHSDTQQQGDGSTTSFSRTLNHHPVLKNSYTISYTIDGTTYTGQDDGEGNITGEHISSGSINYETGERSVEFDTPPDVDTGLTDNYTEQCYSFSGNVATIKLAEQVPRDYSAEDSYAGVALELGDLFCYLFDLNKNSTNGTFDESLIQLENLGTVYDEWTITFQDATTFTCTALYEGSQPNGSINSDYSPINPRTGRPFFTIPPTCWGGSWQAGDSLTFKTHPSAKAIWWKEQVPAGTPREPNNKVYAEWLVE